MALLRGLHEAQLNRLADEASILVVVVCTGSSSDPNPDPNPNQASLETLAAGATLVRQGDKADALYVVRRGHVLCQPKAIAGGMGGKAEPFKLGPGALPNPNPNPSPRPSPSPSPNPNQARCWARVRWRPRRR